MERAGLYLLFLLGVSALGGCKDEEIRSDCYPAVVIDQGCGTVLGILDTSAASVVNAKPQNDTVYVNTFNLHSVYQVPGKKLYISIKSISEEDAPKCPKFIPEIYPHIKILTVSEAPCD